MLSGEQITSVNDVDDLFYRIDMPGHLRHQAGDNFTQVYLSYHGKIPAEEFTKDFGPDERYLYVRHEYKIPKRLIRAYQVKLQGKPGPWLAGMTLAANAVSEAWCHQRGYVCLIEEFGGRPIKPGESFSAAFVVGYFDSIDEMHAVYDQYAGHTRLEVEESGWKLLK